MNRSSTLGGRRTRRLTTFAATLVALGVGGGLLVASGWLVSAARSAAPVEETQLPSIVFIVSDDQRWDTMRWMPLTRRLLGAHGLTFRNAFVTNPLCCPSRASILTGRYSHGTGVWANSSPNGGWSSFAAEGSTLPVYLQEAGYETALVGKYLNGYDGSIVPPGWSRWVGMSDSDYYGYTLNVDGTTQRHGNDPSEYSTRVLADHAVGVIEGTDAPLFLMVTPFAPHAEGDGKRDGVKDLPVPPARLDTVGDLGGAFRSPAWNERDVTDKPAWVRAHAPLDAAAIREIDRFRREQLRALGPLDVAVGRIVDALRRTERLDDALIVFLSDNGYSWGEHRWHSKQVAYEESIRVPMIVRADALIDRPGTAVDELALNIDLAPTAADFAGVTYPAVDGTSLVPLFRRGGEDLRSWFLIEHTATSDRTPAPPDYCAIRDERHTYVRYATGETELYDLRADPHQLENLAATPRGRRIAPRMERRIASSCRLP